MSDRFDQDYRDEIAAMSDDEVRRYAFTMQKSYDEVVAAAENAIDEIDAFGDHFTAYSSGVMELKRVVMYGDRSG